MRKRRGASQERASERGEEAKQRRSEAARQGRRGSGGTHTLSPFPLSHLFTQSPSHRVILTHASRHAPSSPHRVIFAPEGPAIDLLCSHAQAIMEGVDAHSGHRQSSAPTHVRGLLRSDIRGARANPGFEDSRRGYVRSAPSWQCRGKAATQRSREEEEVGAHTLSLPSPSVTCSPSHRVILTHASRLAPILGPRPPHWP